MGDCKDYTHRLMLNQTERGQRGLNWPSGTPICLATQSNMVPKWDKCRIIKFFVASRRGHVFSLGFMSDRVLIPVLLITVLNATAKS